MSHARFALAIAAVLGSLALGSGRPVAAEEKPAAPPADEKVLFHDDFENGLDKWIGRDNEAVTAKIVADPLNPQNKVVTFTRTIVQGDIFTPPIPVSREKRYVLAFDYLGKATPDSTEGNLGGFVGWFDSTWDTSNHGWIAGTDESETSNLLEDDGKWQSARVAFDPFSQFDPAGDKIRIMLEDWEGAFGVAGDCYFDNIRLIELPAEKK